MTPLTTPTEDLRSLVADTLINQRPVDNYMFRIAYRFLTKEGAWDGCPVCGDQYCDADHTQLGDAGWQIQAAHDRGDHDHCSINCDDRREVLMDTAR